jgi:hypothetical protein
MASFVSTFITNHVEAHVSYLFTYLYIATQITASGSEVTFPLDSSCAVTPLRIILCSAGFQMSEEQQQNLKDYPYNAEALLNTVPPMAPNPTTVSRDYTVSRAQIFFSLQDEALTTSGFLRCLRPR